MGASAEEYYVKLSKSIKAIAENRSIALEAARQYWVENKLQATIAEPTMTDFAVKVTIYLDEKSGNILAEHTINLVVKERFTIYNVLHVAEDESLTSYNIAANKENATFFFPDEATEISIHHIFIPKLNFHLKFKKKFVSRILQTISKIF
jgi:hypothetical protein